MPTIVGIGDSLMFLGNFVEPFANRQEWTYSNKGVSGDTTTMMAARFNADVLAQSPQYCLFNGGINDIGLDGTTLPQFLTNWATMLAACKTNGIVAIVISITPRTPIDDPHSATADTWNEALRAQIRGAAYRDTTHVIDLRPWLGQFRGSGPPNNFWDYRPAYTADGVHLNAFGAVVAGMQIQQQFLMRVGSP